jgi:hypothetical protein
MCGSMDWTAALISNSRLFCDARTRRDAAFLTGSRPAFSVDFTMSWIERYGWLSGGLDVKKRGSRKPGPKAWYSGPGLVMQ